MDIAYDFALSGELMDFALGLIKQKCKVPAALFMDILTEKCQLMIQYLRSTRDCLVLVANLSNDQVSIKFHDTHYEISKMKHITLTNQPDLDDQLIYLWTEVRHLMRYFHIDDHNAELSCIDTFYHELEYNQMVAADFNF